MSEEYQLGMDEEYIPSRCLDCVYRDTENSLIGHCSLCRPPLTLKLKEVLDIRPDFCPLATQHKGRKLEKKHVQI